MAGKTPEQEPSIEEILASIRQIISDDEEPARDAAVDLSAQDDAARNAAIDLSQGPEEKFVIPVAQPEPEKKGGQSAVDDIFDLTDEIKEEPKTMRYAQEEKFTIPVAEPEKPRVQVDFQEQPAEEAFMPRSELNGTTEQDSIFTDRAADATANAFSRLIGNMPVEREENATMFADGRITLEDLTRELMRPMLRQWISDNVPRLVERLVEKELEKLARQARDD